MKSKRERLIEELSVVIDELQTYQDNFIDYKGYIYTIPVKCLESLLTDFKYRLEFARRAKELGGKIVTRSYITDIDILKFIMFGRIFRKTTKYGFVLIGNPTDEDIKNMYIVV